MSNLRELIEKARREGHDTLGLASDPETLVVLAKACRRRLIEDGDPSALETWTRVIAELSELPPEEGVDHSWLELQFVELELARKISAERLGAAEPAVSPPPDAGARASGRVPEETRRELGALLELAWATGVRARAADRDSTPSPRTLPGQSETP